MNKTERFWDRMAKDVDPQSDHPEPGQLHVVKNIVKHLKGHEVLLDYGCARGGISFLLADKAKQIHGIDISSKMIDIAKSRAARRKLRNVAFVHAQLSDQQYTPTSFDVVLALNVVHLVGEPGAVVARIHELLKPGGLFISETPCMKGRKTLVGMVGRFVLMLATKLGFVPHLNFMTPQEWKTLVIEKGFLTVESHCKPEPANFSQWIVAKKV